jgi:hypothetical protein
MKPLAPILRCARRLCAAFFFLTVLPFAFSQSVSHRTIQVHRRNTLRFARHAVPPRPRVVPAREKRSVELQAHRRDPFRPLLAKRIGSGRLVPRNLPPGKAGLLVDTTTIQGTIEAPDGPVAVVANPQDRVYFLHVGDRIFDGSIRQITRAGVVFEQHTHDAYGHLIERLVTKPVAAGTGEKR